RCFHQVCSHSHVKKRQSEPLSASKAFHSSRNPANSVLFSINWNTQEYCSAAECRISPSIDKLEVSGVIGFEDIQCIHQAIRKRENGKSGWRYSDKRIAS